MTTFSVTAELTVTCQLTIEVDALNSHAAAVLASDKLTDGDYWELRISVPRTSIGVVRASTVVRDVVDTVSGKVYRQWFAM